MPLRVVVIVEGHGEDGAIRTLLERIWYDLLKGDYMQCEDAYDECYERVREAASLRRPAGRIMLRGTIRRRLQR